MRARILSERQVQGSPGITISQWRTGAIDIAVSRVPGFLKIVRAPDRVIIAGHSVRFSGKMLGLFVAGSYPPIRPTY
jgi:hypothetical protein